MAVGVIIWLLVILEVGSSAEFKIGFLPAMSDILHSHLNEGSRYAGAMTVAMNALRNDTRYNHLNFSYIYEVGIRLYKVIYNIYTR